MPATKDYFRQAVGCLLYGFLKDGLTPEKAIEVLEEITQGYYNPPITSTIGGGLTQEEQNELNEDLQRDADFIASQESNNQKPDEGKEQANGNESSAIRESVG